MAPGDPFAAAVETDPLRLARDENDLSLLIKLIGIGCERDLETRVEQGGVNAILAEIGCYRGGHDDASERFILAGPDLGDALEGRPVHQAARSETTIELSAINSPSHSLPDHPNRGC